MLWKTGGCYDANYFLGQLAGLDSTEIEGAVILQQITNVCTYTSRLVVYVQYDNAS